MLTPVRCPLLSPIVPSQDQSSLLGGRLRVHGTPLTITDTVDPG